MAKRKDPGLLPALSRPERYHHGDLRTALVQGALELLASSPKAVSLRTVARSVGVSPAAVYHHFADVRELLAAVAEEGFRALAATLEGALEGAGDVDSERLVAVYLSHAHGAPARYRVMFHPDLAPRSTFPRLHEAERAVVAALTSFITRSAPGLDTSEVEARANALLAVLHGAADLELLRGALSGGEASSARPGDAGGDADGERAVLARLLRSAMKPLVA